MVNAKVLGGGAGTGYRRRGVSMDMQEYVALDTMLAPLGLVLRGSFDAAPEDELDDTVTVVLVGNTGQGLWGAFDAGRPSGPNPLDTWVHSHLTPIADRLRARLVMPNDGPPYHPFQRWARRAAAVHPSPIGLLIDAEFGLWHALRAALLLPRRIGLPSLDAAPSPCLACREKPCLSTCPVEAFSAAGYDADRCRRHVMSPAGIDCRVRGCRARNACPVGAEHRYPEAQQAFHMDAFLPRSC